MVKENTKPHGGSGGSVTDNEDDKHAPSMPTISPRQERALRVLLVGGTDAEAGKAGGVARETVNRWRHRDADFIATLNQRRRELYESFRDALTAMLPEALAALRDGLAHDNVGIRLRVAETLIRAARAICETPAPANPEAIRTEWRSERSDLDFQVFLSPS